MWNGLILKKRAAPETLIDAWTPRKLRCFGGGWDDHLKQVNKSSLLVVLGNEVYGSCRKCTHGTWEGLSKIEFKNSARILQLNNGVRYFRPLSREKYTRVPEVYILRFI